MLLISLFQHTASADRIREEGRFGVSVLGQDHEAAARAGAAPGKPKFVEEFCHDDDDPAGIPVLRGAIAHLECGVERTVDVADHTIFIGTVAEISLTPGKLPLLYYGRGYAALEQGEPWYS
jgi:flavin reductase (DIM6/NTAB) family NADH-FMN oxidoreductase RutF